MKLASLLLQRFEEVILVLMTSIAVTIVFVNVVLRYCFSFSLPWPGEIAPYMFIAVTFVGSAAAVRTGAHIRIDVILRIFPGFKKVSGYISDLLFLIYGIMVLFFSLDTLRDFWDVEQAMISLPIPMYYAYVFVPLGAVLIIFRVGEKVIKQAMARH